MINAKKHDITEDKQAYTYMVECSDGSLYTGWTYDLQKRMKAHNSGTGSKYTRSRLPVRLVYYELHSNKIGAMQREYAIKHITRADKLKLIDSQPAENTVYCVSLTNKKK